MKTGFFLAAGLAALLAFEKKAGPKIERDLLALIKEGLLLFAASAVLVFIASAAPAGWAVEAGFFLSWAGSYALSHFLKRKDVFFLVLFCLTMFVLKEPFLFSLAGRMAALAALASAILIFEILALGLKQRLLFSSVPQALSGLPIFLMMSSLLALALTGLLTMVPLP